MSEQLHEMLAFVLSEDADLTEGKARSLAAYFSELADFSRLRKEELKDIKGIGGKRTIVFNEEQMERILEINRKGLIDPSKSVSENYLCAVGRYFTRTQISMIRALRLDSLNTNPFLIKTLNLHTPKELVRINVYMSATRSIVTSMGFLIEKLLLASSESMEKGPRGSGWDVIKTKDGVKHWIQAKCGPNDMDKDQIDTWAKKIEEKIAEGDQAYIGISYGKRTNQTVTLGLMQQLLPDWEMRTLIGKELWDFVSEEPDYHTKLFTTLHRAATQILNRSSICDEIEACIKRIEEEFIEKYGEGEEGVSGYINEIF